MHYKIMHLRFVSTNIHALTPTSVYEFGSRHRNGVDNIPNFHTALTHCTQLPHMLQNSYNALTLYSKLPHDIQSPPAHYTKLTHIIPHILQGIDILFEAHRMLEVFHCFILLRDFNTQTVSNAEVVCRRHKRTVPTTVVLPNVIHDRGVIMSELRQLLMTLTTLILPNPHLP